MNRRNVPYSNSVLSAAVLLLIATPLPAQAGEGSRWNTIPLPSGASAVRAIGTTVTVKTPTRIHLYSGILRRWTVLPASANAILMTHNAYATIEDGNKVHGWTSRVGRVETITVSPSRKVIPGPATANWITLVVDGNKVYGFSAFKGKWTPLTLTGSRRTVAVGQLTAVVHDGINAYGFGVNHGTWVATPAPGNVAVQASGVVGMANWPKMIRGFSAEANTWATRLVASTSNLTMQRGYALVTNGKTVTAFSGYRGTFSTFTSASSGFQTMAGRNTAAIVDGNKVACYAAAEGSFQTIAASSPKVAVNSELAVISSTAVGSTRVVGFSGATGRFSKPVVAPSFTVTTDESAAFAKGTPLTLSYAYSPILNRWVRASQVNFSSVTMLRNSVVLTHPGGFTGFSSRYPRWESLATSNAAVLNGPRRGRGATLVVTDGNVMRAWDSRLGRWAKATAGNLPNLSIFRVVALAEDGNTGYGFGLFNNVWDTVQLQGANPSMKASSSIGFIQTTTHLHVFTAHGSLSTLSRFPEFSRFQTRGSNLRLIQSAPARSAALTFVGFAPTFTRTLFGLLFVDLGGPAISFVAPPVPGDGRLDYSLPVPNDPSLSGLALHIQNLIVPPAGLPYLTNSTSPVIL